MSTANVGWRSHGLLLLLAIVYADNFVGRQILAVMIEPIKLEFGISDTAMGLMCGLTFAAVQASLGLSAGRLADRRSRTRLLAASGLLWAVATMACGLASSFLLLAIARMVVAASESPTTSASMSIIADLYPPQRRSFAISCFTAAPTLSAIIGLSLGAWGVEHYGWRTAFTIIGLPALAFSTLLAFVVREPARGKWDLPETRPLVGHTAQPGQSLLGEARALWALPAYRCLVLASGLATLSSYAIGMWNTSFLVRSHDLSLQHAGLLAGLICGTVSAIGGLFSGGLSDHLSRRHPHWQVSIPVIGHLAAIVSLTLYLLWPSTLLGHVGQVAVPSAMLWCALYSFFAVWWVAPTYNRITQQVPHNRRGTAMALQTIVATLLGVGIGPLLSGLLSDALLPYFGRESLRYALLLVSLPMMGSVYLLLRSSRPVRGLIGDPEGQSGRFPAA